VAESKGLSVSPDEPASEVTEPIDDESRVTEEAPAGYRLRRAPRYRAFGLTGVIVGIVIGAVLAMSFQATGDYSAQTILGYFVAIFGLLGALFGGGVAVLLDRKKR
jgi:predicted phage tail protein